VGSQQWCSEQKGDLRASAKGGGVRRRTTICEATKGNRQLRRGNRVAQERKKRSDAKTLERNHPGTPKGGKKARTVQKVLPRRDKGVIVIRGAACSSGGKREEY